MRFFWHALPAVATKSLIEVIKDSKIETEVVLEGGRKIIDCEIVHPCLLALPMGYLHSQYLAQTLHETIVQTHRRLRDAHQVTDAGARLAHEPEVQYGLVCDDLFGFARMSFRNQPICAHVHRASTGTCFLKFRHLALL